MARVFVLVEDEIGRQTGRGASFAKSVKEALKEMDGCKAIKIYQSTLIENERWKGAANPHLDQKGT